VELECFVTNMHTISAWCYSDPSHHPRLLSCIYGSPYYSSQAQFWDNIMSIGDKYYGPWLCIGDFHMILDQTNKSGGLPFASSSDDFFRTFMNDCGMVDLGYSGNSFTWSNHREWRNLIKQHLDWGVAPTQ